MAYEHLAVRAIIDGGVDVFPHDAAAILHEVCANVVRQKNRPLAVPHIDDLLIDGEGRVLMRERRHVPDGEVLPTLGNLLLELLGSPAFRAEPVQGEGLLEVAARASVRGHEGFADVKDLQVALGRLDRDWRRRFVRDLYQRASQYTPRPALPEAAPQAAEAPASAAAGVQAAAVSEPVPVSPAVVETTSAALPADLSGPASDVEPGTAVQQDESSSAALPVVRSFTVVPSSASSRRASSKVQRPVRRVPTSVGDLKLIREESGVTLEQIAERTKIARPLLYELESGSLRHWPPGIYRRSWIRSYAEEAGLDPDRVISMLCEPIAAPAPEVAEVPAPVEPPPQPAAPSRARPAVRDRGFLQRLLTGVAGVLAIYVVVSGSISPLSSQSINRPIAIGPDGRVHDLTPVLEQTQPLPSEPVLIFPERAADAVPRVRSTPPLKPNTPADAAAAAPADPAAPVAPPPPAAGPALPAASPGSAATTRPPPA